MPLIKNALLFGGWIPTLLTGGGAIWWLTSDKTVEDALKRTGLNFLSSKENFQNIYDEFEADVNLAKDIPEVTQKKGEAISEWCKETLQKPLDNEGKKLLTKAVRYCMESNKITGGASKFRNFDKILNLLQSSGLETKHMGGLKMSLIGDENIYFGLTGEDDLKNGWRLVSSSAKDLDFASKLVIDDKHRMLSYFGSNDNSQWEQKAQEYDRTNEKKFPDLPKAFAEIGPSGLTTRTNNVKNHCRALLSKWYKTKEELESTKDLFVKWCTIPAEHK